MDISLLIISILFLIGPGVFLLLAGTAYESWWSDILDKLNVDFITEHGITITCVIGGIMTAIGALLVVKAAFARKVTNGATKTIQMQQVSKKPSSNRKTRVIHTNKKTGRKYIRVDGNRHYIK